MRLCYLLGVRIMKGKELPVRYSKRRRKPRNRGMLRLMMVFCLGAVGLALISQHVFGMQPCPWCVLQRAQFLAIALVCWLALTTPQSGLRWACLALGLSLVGFATTLCLSVTNSAFSCDLSFADQIISSLALDRLMPALLAPSSSCADGTVELLGMLYQVLALAAFAFCSFSSVLLFLSGIAIKVNKRVQLAGETGRVSGPLFDTTSCNDT